SPEKTRRRNSSSCRCDCRTGLTAAADGGLKEDRSERRSIDRKTERPRGSASPDIPPGPSEPLGREQTRAVGANPSRRITDPQGRRLPAGPSAQLLLRAEWRRLDEPSRSPFPHRPRPFLSYPPNTKARAAWARPSVRIRGAPQG